jgi:zinc protease
MRATGLKTLQTLVAGLAGLLAGPGLHASVVGDAVRAEINGIDVVIVPTEVRDVVTLAGSLGAGDDRSPPDNVALATLTGAMLDKGTTRQDKFAVAQQLGGVGATLSFSVGASALQVGGKCLGKDLPRLVSLLAEQLREPAFTDAELAKLKKQLDGAVRAQLEDTDFRADDAFSRAVFPPGHPNRQPAPEEFLAAIGRTTPEEIRRFHAQHYGPTGMRLVIVGDVDPAAAQAEIRKAFAGWSGGSVLPSPPRAARAAESRQETVFMADKTSVSVVLGQATGLRYGDPDALALRLGTRIFGSGFTGRLMSTVRDKEGLTYGIGAGVTNDTFVDGDWRVTATFAPALLEQGLASTRRELEAWHNEGVTNEELARAKTRTAGQYTVGLATTSGLAGTILTMLNAGQPLSFVDEYPQRINALTLDEVNGAIRRHLDPDRMVLVQAGTVGNGMAAPKP